MIPRVQGTSRPDDPAKSCVVDVEGSNHMQMLIAAKKTAAKFLSEPFDNLVARAASTASPTAYSRFQSHLGQDRTPIRWKMTVTINLDPEIVKARREAVRQKAQAALPLRPEDGA
jgi:hypothetical protein